MRQLDVPFAQRGDKSIFICPSHRNTYPQDAYRTYALNLSGAEPTVDAPRLLSLTNPSQTALLVESRFIDPIADTYRQSCELVGLCDSSATRRRWHQQRLCKEYGIDPIPDYGIEDFDRMLAEGQPDTVVVCVPDSLHHEYIVRSLEFGADVICEKPLTTDADKFAVIEDAVRRTGKRVRTTFNYRWAPGATQVRKLIAEGAIGTVKHVDFEYMLNTAHGADYFRRWHSYKELSGGLFVHKCTHHFDLINWWIDAIPETVFAMGALAFYGKDNAVARGQEALTRYDRYTGVEASEGDPFRMNLEGDPTLKGLYLEAEKDSGYIRDENVFREGIDIEDSLSATIRYRSGVIASYSLNAYCPAEGFRVAITGDEGRLEYSETHAAHIITGDRDIKFEPTASRGASLKVHRLFEEPQVIPINMPEGGHGGADPLIQEQMFSENPAPESYGRNAGHQQGAASLLVGAAGNRSIATGQAIRITDLYPLSPESVQLSELI
ncbi:MAG TPA: gfo/Idh/MocA family oxidoreductase [Opitutae bacterium]|nr:oxidoreductase [Puniceicoccaceae bacterium]HBR95684.1 gfo/Idh/MocA family oxidoreductase [Opitutae bacterium]